MYQRCILLLIRLFFICRIKKDEEARQAELESIVKEKDVKSKMILDEKKYATKAVCILKQTFIPISKPFSVIFPDCFSYKLCTNNNIWFFAFRVLTVHLIG